jgi:cobalt transporter subunit CbtA
MYSRFLISAIFAGAAAGLIAGILQLMFVQPVLLHAELYEGGQLVHSGVAFNSVQPDLPSFDAVRDGMSVIFTMLTYTGYALIMISAMGIAEDRGAQIDGRWGILWGFAGFVAFHLAPGFGLAPAVPSVASADVTDRQIWWFATVFTAAAGLWMLAFGRNWMMWGGAIVVLLAPHLIGAPQPDSFTGPVPTEIGALFAVRALGVGLAAWVLLGCFAGYFWQREGVQAGTAVRAQR